jgi:hypothetical protein
VAGWLPDGTALSDVVGGTSLAVEAGTVVVSLPGRGVAVLLTEAGADLAPPAAPGSLVAEAESGAVSLSWAASSDATAYDVWRSVVFGGGYERIGEVTDGTTYDDRSARNGTTYHYVVTARDVAGNGSARSPEAVALPQVTLAEARIDGPETVSQPLSAVEPGAEIAVLVRADRSSAEGATIGVKTELGFGPADADPADDEAWTWSPMRYAGEADGADRLVGSVRPETAGTHAVAVRISTDGGASWVVADRDGIGYDPSAALTVEALPPADVEAPPAPGGAAASVASDTAVTLVWEPVDAADLYRYEVWRADEPDRESVRIGTAGEPTFTDGTVRSGGSSSP